MSYPHKSAEDIIESQNRYMFPCTPKYRQPVVIVEGRGALVKDINGREYIDLFGGYAAVNVGHCHPRVVRAIIEWAQKIHHTSYDYYNIPSAVLAEKLVQVLPMKGSKKVFFCVSGAEANEGAIKLARKYMFRFKRKAGLDILAVRYSFHGRTHLTVALTGQTKYKKSMAISAALPGVKIIPAPYCFRCPFRMKYPECGVLCAYYIEDVIKYETSGDVGAFLIEPVLGEGGIIVPPREYLKIAHDIIKSYDSLLIADEVQTGFGRTGKLFGIENFDVEPDIMSMAKGITSGLPLGAIGAKAEVADAFDHGDHSSTWGPNAVTCAAAAEVINVLFEEKLHEKARDLGEYFMKRLNELADKHKIIGEVRGLGLMIGVELVKDEKKTPAAAEALKIREKMRERGFLIGAGGAYGCTLRIEPPLMITKDQVDRAVDALDEVLKEN